MLRCSGSIYIVLEYFNQLQYCIEHSSKSIHYWLVINVDLYASNDNVFLSVKSEALTFIFIKVNAVTFSKILIMDLITFVIVPLDSFHEVTLSINSHSVRVLSCSAHMFDGYNVRFLTTMPRTEYLQEYLVEMY